MGEDEGIHLVTDSLVSFDNKALGHQAESFSLELIFSFALFSDPRCALNGYSLTSSQRSLGPRQGRTLNRPQNSPGTEQAAEERSLENFLLKARW